MTSQRKTNMKTSDTLRDTRIHTTHGSGEIPAVGFGTLIPDPLATKQATRAALEAGFRHLDCAERYRNEAAVGDAIQEAFKAGTLRREDLFVTTKLWNTNHRPERVKPAFDASCRRLQLDYIDCYIIHTPFAFQPGDEQDPRDEHGRVIYDSGVTLVETWRALERLVDDGHCRSIGLSDITLEKLREIVAAARIKPAMVQVEVPSVSSRMGAARFLPRARHCSAGVCSVGPRHGAKRAGRPGDYSYRTACAQDAGSSCTGLGRTARYRFPDHLDQTFADPGEL